MQPALASTSQAPVAEALRGLLRRYPAGAHLETDPVRYAHRYRRAQDREIVAYLAAGLAFGRVTAIFSALDRLLPRLGAAPEEAARAAAPRRPAWGRREPGHRWVRGEDLAEVVAILGRILEEYGSLEHAFLAGDEGGESYESALVAWRTLAHRHARRWTRGVQTFFTSPRTGACKRLCLFLRWVIRPADGTDLGLWKRGDPARLVIPLDTHVLTFARALGLSARRTPDFRLAREVTEALRALDARDPVQYDWALSRLGILGHCPGHRQEAGCEPCSLRSCCRL